SALVVTRMLLEILTKWSGLDNRPGLMGMTTGRRFQHWLTSGRFDLFRRPRMWLIVSAVVVAVALAGLVVRGPSFGLEFLGGRLVESTPAQSVDLDELRADLADAGFPRALIQESGQGTVVIRTEQVTPEEADVIEAAVAELGGELTLVRDQFVGPTLGAELRN